MATDELDAMLVRGLAQARLVYDRLEYFIQPAAQREIEKAFRDGADALGWRGRFEWNVEDLWLAPGEWVVESDAEDAEPTYLGLVRFDADNQGGEEAGADHYWLVTACRAGRGRYGLSLVRGRDLGMSNAKWRKLVNGHPAVDRLVGLGFGYRDDGTFFKPVEFDAEALATAIETDDYTGFTAPLAQAISELPKAAEVFGEIVSDARKATVGA